jgi:DNA-directed RNA polymerase specialized sigma24 family protein
MRGDALDESAEELLRHAFEVHYVALLGLSTLLAAGSPDAEDIVQDVFVRATNHLQRLSTAEVRPYLRTGVVNAWRNERRRLTAEGRKRRAAAVLTSPNLGPDEGLWQEIIQLPARQRACLVLRYYEDLPEREVATLLHCSVGTVKSQTSRALEKLRKAVTR